MASGRTPLPHGKIRLVATDLDGTLLRSDGSLSERTVEALHRTEQAGIEHVIVTARPPRTVRTLIGGSGIEGLAICLNGALVYDLGADRVVRDSPIATEIARELVGAIQTAAPRVTFAVECGLSYGCEPNFLPSTARANPDEARTVEALALRTSPVSKLIAWHPEIDRDALMRLVVDAVGEAAQVTHSGGPFVEIMAAGVSKAAALAMLCAEIGVEPPEVIAFGDMPNDIPLLTWAGCGVAVANAHPDLLAVADIVTCANDEDGVAVVLETLVSP